jgi:hypothetical protein
MNIWASSALRWSTYHDGTSFVSAQITVQAYTSPYPNGPHVRAGTFLALEYQKDQIPIALDASGRQVDRLFRIEGVAVGASVAG